MLRLFNKGPLHIQSGNSESEASCAISTHRDWREHISNLVIRGANGSMLSCARCIVEAAESRAKAMLSLSMALLDCGVEITHFVIGGARAVSRVCADAGKAGRLAEGMLFLGRRGVQNAGGLLHVQALNRK